MTRAQRSFSLGRVGEQRWRMLAGAYQLDPGMGRALIIAEPRDVRDEIRRRLLSLGPLTVLVPSVSVLEQIHGLAGGDQIPIVWIEATTDTAVEDEWGRALMALNRGRDLIGDGGPVFVVLAGDRRFFEFLSLRAPDLNHVLNPFLFEERLEMLGEPSGPLCWMHLSDLHVSGNDWEQDVVLRSLARDLPGLLERAERRPQLLFVTGDISNRGKEFEAARRVIEELRDKLGIDSTRVFVVPGNHDVDRGAIGVAAEMARRGILQLDAEARRHNVGNIVSKSEEMQLFGKRLANWCAFTEKLGRRVTVGEPWRSDVVDVAGVAVGVASLCSAWLSGDGSDDKKLALRDDKNLALGEPQLRRMIEQLEQAGAQLRVALLHHPPTGWLADVETGDVESLLDEHFDLVLHGHLHYPGAKVVSRGSGATIWMGAGAAYDRHADDRWYGFFVGQLDGARTEVSIDAFTWTSHSGGHWHPDAGFDTQGGSSRRTLPFRPPRIGKSEAVAEVRDDAIAARICQSAARVHAAHAFVGLPDSAPKPAAELSSIYVAPSLIRLGQHADELSLDAFVNSARQAGERKLDVVLGPPGSGKSMLCRYVALGQAQHGERVPLLFIVREWAVDGARAGLFDAVAKQLSDGLSVLVDAATVERLCERGDVTLLVDGVDEVGESARVRLRDMIHGFVASFPAASVIVTSRELGYDEAPLVGFTSWRLAEFDDARLRDFVDRWYSVVSLPQPQERARKRADLLAALDAEPRVKELARNPLLATLIALVHTHRAELPGRRARLYELCVELLVITWPAASHRTVPELPGEWQVAHLEELALWMLRKRDSQTDGGGVLVSADDLEAQLCELLAKHRDDLDESRRRRLAGRWLRWLVDSGLLQEQRHDAYGFLHLSIMEYLAGRGLLHEQLSGGHDQVADFVVRHHRFSQWSECILLMLGSEASNTALSRTVVTKLLASPHPSPMFLLSLLREEIQFDGRVRDQLLELVAQMAIVDGSHRWLQYRALTYDVWRFSRMHGNALASWIDTKLGVQTGERLLSVLAITPSIYQPPSTLTSRSPAELELVPLLELGDADVWGRWALEQARATDWLAWAQSGLLRGVSSYALMSTKRTYRAYCAAWIVGVLRRAAFLAGSLREPPGQAHAYERRCWQLAGYKAAIPLMPAYQCVGPATGSQPTVSSRPVPPYLINALYDLGVEYLLTCPYTHKRTLLDADSAQRFRRFNGVQFVAANFSSWLFGSEQDTTSDTVSSATLARMAKFVYGREIPSTESLVLVPVALGELPRPDSIPGLPWTIETPLSHEFPPSWPTAVTMLASFHGGLSIGPRSVEIAEMFVHNLWINLFFDAIVANAQSDGTLSPSQHALLLALGLAQFQTTWHWPLSDHWHTWFATNTPPNDPIAAHVWHLCWLAAEPDNPHHREQANACLDRATWPELAAELRKFTIS